MKYFCVIIGLLLASGWTLAADDGMVTILEEVSGGYDKNLPLDKQHMISFKWKVSLAVWRQAPAWTPEKGPVPLDAHAAAVAARRWINAQPWADRFEKFTAVDLTNQSAVLTQFPEDEKIWFYKLSFDVKQDPGHDTPSLAIVLLNGAVLEPTPGKPYLGTDHP